MTDSDSAQRRQLGTRLYTTATTAMSVVRTVWGRPVMRACYASQSAASAATVIRWVNEPSRELMMRSINMQIILRQWQVSGNGRCSETAMYTPTCRPHGTCHHRMPRPKRTIHGFCSVSTQTLCSCTSDFIAAVDDKQFSSSSIAKVLNMFSLPTPLHLPPPTQRILDSVSVSLRHTVEIFIIPSLIRCQVQNMSIASFDIQGDTKK